MMLKLLNVKNEAISPTYGCKKRLQLLGQAA